MRASGPFARAVPLLVVLLTGCVQARTEPWRCDAPAARTFVHRGIEYDVVCVPAPEKHLRLHWKSEKGEPWGTLPALRRSLEASGRPAFALTNAGIFEPGQVPTGLLIAAGKQEHPLNLAQGQGNFFLQPNGVFFVTSGGAGILESHQFAARGTHDVLDATQSGPLLVQAGTIHSKLKSGSVNAAIRSGVGVARPDLVYLAISRDGANLWRFATLFLDRLGCRDALYLDGAISELSAPSLGRAGGMTRFAGIISVESSPR